MPVDLAAVLARGMKPRASGDPKGRPLTDDKEVARGCFKQLREIRDAATQNFSGLPNVTMQYLSMGMTEDFEIAIEEGSNMVRVGRAIFQ